MADIREDGSELIHYDNPDFQVFYRKNYIPMDTVLTSMRIHWHDEIELIYVVEGSIIQKLNRERILLHKGEGIFINARQLHEVEPVHEDCVLHCLIFSPMILCSTLLIANKYVSPIIKNNKLEYIILDEKTDWQREVLYTFKSLEEDYKNEINEINVIEKIFSMWKRVFENTELHTGYNPEKFDTIAMKQMISYIQNNISGKINLAGICKVAGVGKTKASELFRQFLNQSPMEYVSNYRLDKSRTLLEEGDMSISDIAYECGFSDVSYYSKLFKEKWGKSPRKYREEL